MISMFNQSESIFPQIIKNERQIRTLQSKIIPKTLQQMSDQDN